MELPKRKQIRLGNFDYSSSGAYFVTVCVADQKTLLREIGTDVIRPGDVPVLTRIGAIVNEAILAIPSHYDGIAVDKYCIMPDHVHMIVFISTNGYGGRIISAPTLSTVIGSMKRWVSKQAGYPIWQKSFIDEIIRNEQGYKEIWRYIDENPTKLSLGKEQW